MTGETLFISRAGPDSAISETVAGILERAGYDVILQQRSFVNKSFMGQMQAALQFDRHPLFFVMAVEILASVATLSGDARRGSLLHGYVEAAYRNFALTLNLDSNYPVHQRLLQKKLEPI